MNYLDFPKYLLNVAKDAYLNNCPKTIHYAQKYLLNCFILPAKPLDCSSFSFTYVCMHACLFVRVSATT